MRPPQQQPHHVGGRQHLLRFRDPHRDLLDRIGVVHVGEALERGGDRNIDVLIDVAQLQHRGLALAHRARLHHSDHGEPVVFDADPAVDRIPVPEQLPTHLGADHAHPLGLAHVERGEEPALGRAKVRDLVVVLVGADQAAGRAALAQHHFRVDEFHRARAQHIGNVVANQEPVAVGEPARRRGFDLGRLLAGTVRGLDADVVGAQHLDLGDRVAPGALADGEHRHHGGHAEHHAEHGEQRPQLVGHDAVDADAQRFRVFDHGSRGGAEPRPRPRKVGRAIPLLPPSGSIR